MTDVITGEGIVGAIIMVEGIAHNITSIESGAYWRLLAPGSYTLTVVADG